MKYLITSYENFGVFREVNSLIGKYEVIGEKDVIDFIQNHAPHLVNFDGQRAYTNRPEELAFQLAGHRRKQIYTTIRTSPAGGLVGTPPAGSGNPGAK